MEDPLLLLHLAEEYGIADDDWNDGDALCLLKLIIAQNEALLNELKGIREDT